MFLKQRTKKAVKRGLAFLLSIVMLGGSVFTEASILRASGAEPDISGDNSAEEQTSELIYYVAPESDNSTVEVSGGDALAQPIQPSEVKFLGEYDLMNYITDTAVTVNGQDIAGIDFVEKNAEVQLSLVWSLDTYSITGEEGLAAFAYTLPEMIDWEAVDTVSEQTGYAVDGNRLMIYEKSEKDREQTEGNLSINGMFPENMVKDAEGNLVFPDGSAFISASVKTSGLTWDDVTTKEWAEKGLLPYENYVYGESTQSGYFEYDRNEVKYYDALLDLDVDELNSEDAEYVRKMEFVVNGGLGEVAENTYFMFVEDVDSIISMAEEGIDLNKFFYGNALFGTTLEDLYEIKENNDSLDKLLMEKDSIYKDITLSRIVDLGGELAVATTVSALLTKRMAAAGGSNIAGLLGAGSANSVTNMFKMNTGAVGYIPEFGPNPHGPLWDITTAQEEDGGPTMCAGFGKSLRTGDQLVEIDASSIVNSNQEAAILAVLELYDIYRYGPDGTQNNQTHPLKVMTQCLIWYVLGGNGLSYDTSSDTYENMTSVMNRAMSNIGLSAGEVAWADSQLAQWAEYYHANLDDSYTVKPRRNIVVAHWWDHVGGGNRQPLITWSSDVVDEIPFYGRLFVGKVDDSGNYLAGCAFAVYNEDGTLFKTFYTEDTAYVIENIPLPSDTKTRKFMIEELIAPEGYQRDEMIHVVTVTEAESDMDGVMITLVNKTQKPHISFVKYNKSTTTYVDGYGEFQVLDASGAVVHTMLFGEGGPIIVSLDPGDYILHEVNPPKGYIAAEDIPFTVTGNYFTDNGTVAVYEDYTKVRFAKVDDNGNPLPGAILQVYKTDGYKNNVAMIDQWTTDGTLHEIDKLEIGEEYALVELAAPDGYQKAETIYFRVLATASPITITMTDSPRKYGILKIDELTGEAISGAKLQLWDIDGQNNPTVMLDEWVSDGTVHIVEGLKSKSYLVREVEAPHGYTNFGDKIITFGHIHSASCYSVGTAEFTHVTVFVDDEGTATGYNNNEEAGVRYSETYYSSSPNTALNAIPATATKQRDILDDYFEDEDGDGQNGLKANTTYTIPVTPGETIHYRAAIANNTWDEHHDKDKEESWRRITYTDAAGNSGIPIPGVQEKKTWISIQRYLDHNGMKQNGYRYWDTESDDPWATLAEGEAKWYYVDGNQVVEYGISWDEADDESVDDFPQNSIVGQRTGTVDGNYNVDWGNWYSTGKKIGDFGWPNPWYFETDHSYDRRMFVRDDSYVNGGASQEFPSLYGNRDFAINDGSADSAGIDWYDNSVLVFYDSFVVPENATSITLELNTIVKRWRDEVYLASSIYRDVNELTCGLEEGDLSNQTIEVGNTRNDVTNPHISIRKVERSKYAAESDIPGATLELRDAGGAVVDTWVTDGKAHYIPSIAAGTYTLHETAAPSGYTTAAPLTIVVENKKTLQTYTMYEGGTTLKVRKLDRANSEALPGAALQIWTADDAGTPVTLYSEFVSGFSDKTFTKIPVGKYVLIETKAPEGYMLAAPVVFDVLDSEDEQSVTMFDDQIELHVSKKEVVGNKELPGAQLQIFTTKEDGSADKIYDSWTSTDEEHVIYGINPGNYILREIRTPKGYLEASEIPFTITQDQKIHSVTMMDESIDVTIDKRDIHTNESLAGARLALAKKETADGYAVPGKVVEEWTSDGTPHPIHAIEAGDYVIFEIEAPEGYSRIGYKEITIAPISTVQTFTVDDDYAFMPFTIKKVDGTTGEVIETNAAFELYEWSVSANAYVLSPNFKIVRLADKSYSVTRTASSQYAGWTAWEDGNLYWTPDNQGRFYYKEAKAPDGYVLDAEPVYINVLDPELVNNLDAEYKGSNANPAAYPVNDSKVFANQITRNLFTKSDIVSGAVFDDAILQILEITGENADGSYKTELVETWKSDKDEKHYFYESNNNYFEIGSETELPAGKDLVVKEGHLIEGLKPGTSYIFRELTAPEGYVGYNWSDEATRDSNRLENSTSEEIRFTVEDNNICAEHDMKDQRVVGEISITKEGEVVVSAEKTFTDAAKDLFYTFFGYSAGRVKGTTFEVYVLEDILTPDGTGKVAAYNDIELVADAKVATITTDATGVAKITGLPLGSYYIKEVVAGEGEFLLNKIATPVHLRYQGQDEPVVMDSAFYTNDRQKVDLTVAKRSSAEVESQYMNGEEPVPAPGEDFYVQGAIFGLYNKEDIQGYEIDENTGTVTRRADALITADTLIETIETGTTGVGRFVSDLPCGIYYIKEVVAPRGYHTSDEVYEFDASYTGQDGEDTITLAYNFYNTPTVVKITKYDITSKKELPGAELEVRDSKGNVVDKWISTEKEHYIRHLAFDEEYTLIETKPADGYVTAESVAFKVRDVDENGNIVPFEEVKLYDDITTISVSKRDIDWKDFPEKPDLAGAELELWQVDGLKNKVKLVEKWTSEKNPHLIQKLPIGDYVLVEIKAPDGYDRADDVFYSVKDTKDMQYLYMFDCEEDDEEIEIKIKEAKLKLEDQTGEGSHIFLYLALAICSLGAGTGVAARLRNRKKDH